MSRKDQEINNNDIQLNLKIGKILGHFSKEDI